MTSDRVLRHRRRDGCRLSSDRRRQRERKRSRSASFPVGGLRRFLALLEPQKFDEFGRATNDFRRRIVELHFDAFDVLLASQVALVGHEVGDNYAHGICLEVSQGTLWIFTGLDSDMTCQRRKPSATCLFSGAFQLRGEPPPGFALPTRSTGALLPVGKARCRVLFALMDARRSPILYLTSEAICLLFHT